MVRTKQVNIKNGAVLNRDFPRRSRSLIMVPEELRRLYPNAKSENIEMALERFGDYECDESESEIELFGMDHAQKSRQKIKENHRPNWEASHYYANEGGESYKSHGYT